MNENYIELRQRRDLGDIITVYFDFFKQNLKSFTNIFISYNGIFILLILLSSYLLVTGFIGAFNSSGPDSDANLYIGLGAILFFLVFIVIAALNYSLASSYMIKYTEHQKVITDRKIVWNFIKDNLGSIFLFILLIVFIYFAFMIVSVILAFIPLLGTLTQYVIQFWITSWIGVSFMVMLNENKGVTDSLGEGWDLVKSNFWKCVGVNFILGLLIGILLLLLLTIPGVLVGFYSFHIVENGTVIAESAVAKIIYTFSLCIFLVILAYSQSISQFVNGILYFSLHEQKYNVKTRERIDQIGAGE